MPSRAQKSKVQITTRLDVVEQDLIDMLNKIEKGYYNGAKKRSSPVQNKQTSKLIRSSLSPTFEKFATSKSSSTIHPTSFGDIGGFLSAFAYQTTLEFPDLGGSQIQANGENSFESSTPLDLGESSYLKNGQMFFQNNVLLSIPTTSVVTTQSYFSMAANEQCAGKTKMIEKPFITPIKSVEQHTTIATNESNVSVQLTKAGNPRKPRGRPKQASCSPSTSNSSLKAKTLSPGTPTSKPKDISKPASKPKPIDAKLKQGNSKQRKKKDISTSETPANTHNELKDNVSTKNVHSIRSMPSLNSLNGESFAESSLKLHLSEESTCTPSGLGQLDNQTGFDNTLSNNFVDKQKSSQLLAAINSIIDDSNSDCINDPNMNSTAQLLTSSQLSSDNIFSFKHSEKSLESNMSLNVKESLEAIANNVNQGMNETDLNEILQERITLEDTKSNMTLDFKERFEAMTNNLIKDMNEAELNEILQERITLQDFTLQDTTFPEQQPMAADDLLTFLDTQDFFKVQLYINDKKDITGDLKTPNTSANNNFTKLAVKPGRKSTTKIAKTRKFDTFENDVEDNNLNKRICFSEADTKDVVTNADLLDLVSKINTSTNVANINLNSSTENVNSTVSINTKKDCIEIENDCSKKKTIVITSEKLEIDNASKFQRPKNSTTNDVLPLPVF